MYAKSVLIYMLCTERRVQNIIFNSGIPISWTHSLSNLPITRTKSPDNSNQKSFLLLSQTLQFYRRFLKLLDFLTNFHFPWRFKNRDSTVYNYYISFISQSADWVLS